MKSLKFIMFFLIFIGIAVFPNVVLAQQKPAIVLTHVDKSEPKLISGNITAVNASNKTFTFNYQGKSVTLSSVNLKLRPVIGVHIVFKEDRSKIIYNTCENCKAACPGVCFLEPDYCRCYLENL